MPLRLTFGEFELDEARFELRERGEPVSVQPKVLDLIFHLARHRDRMVGKEELFETVWKGVAVTEASLSQALSLARRALGDSAESQHTIRTIRSKGFQFVAPESAAVARAAPQAPTRASGITMLETARADAPAPAPAADAPWLYAALHCEAPLDGGASWSLADTDEVRIGRASDRRAQREPGLTHLLTIAVPGRLMSRNHARMVRTPGEWVVCDEASKNGTFVNGERVDKRVLQPGDLLECGRTIFRFAHEPAQAGADVDSRASKDTILASVTPAVLALDRDLRRVATSDLPVLIIGESGTGKTHVANALHRLSARRGPLVRVEAATLGADGAIAAGGGSIFERARHGTVLIENLERLPEAILPVLAAALGSTPEVRLLSTSVAPLAALEARIPGEVLMRLGGYRCELPALRERVGDVGVLAAQVLDPIGRRIEIDVAAAHALMRHGWPGNVRELEHAVRAAATLSSDGTIRLAQLLPQIRSRTS
jgi:DNA-binding winged helix-turn-helix (wHTH) protein